MKVLRRLFYCVLFSQLKKITFLWCGFIYNNPAKNKWNKIKMKRIYVLRAQQAMPKQQQQDATQNHEDWYEWLEQQAIANNMSITEIVLPDPEQSNFMAWQSILARDLAKLNDTSTVIASDLASLAVLHYLSQSQQQIHGLLLIAPFTTQLPNRPELKTFIEQAQLVHEQLRLQAAKRILFFSSNDSTVPPPFSLKLVPLFNMQPIEVKNAGHFKNQKDTSVYAPIWQAVSKLLNAI